MHPQLRVLDETAITRTESSAHGLHPIQDAFPARSRGIPLLLSLGLTPILIYTLSTSLISPVSRQAVQGAIEKASRSVSLLLQEPDAPSGAETPVRILVRSHGPGNEGHQGRTGTLDSSKANIHATNLSMLSEAVAPDELGLPSRAEQVDISLMPVIPIPIDGDRLARGTGQGGGRGAGRGAGLGTGGPVHDLELIPTRQVPVFHRLIQGEDSAARQPVKVRILIGDDGVPFQATVISGPSFLHEEALKAALEWRFEPLGAHGLKGPQKLTLKFYPVPQH